MLHCAGEQPYVIDIEAEEPDRRAALLRSDGLDLALIAISSPIGIEALPDRDARERGGEACRNQHAPNIGDGKSHGS